MNQKIFDGAPIPKFQVRGATTDQVSRSRHLIDEGEATCARAHETGGTDVDRIESVTLGLDRLGAVTAPSPTDMAVGADQPGNDGLASDIDAHGPIRDNDILHRSDLFNLSIANEKCPLLNHLRRNRNDACTDKGLDIRSTGRG